MNSVTINGHTYTDDSNTSTGLAAGGHRTRFIPLISDVVTVAAEVESDRAEVAANTATVAADKAMVAADKATVAADKASAAASAAAALVSENAAAVSAVAALVSEQNAHAISESGLPSQAGHAGDYLLTNGTITSWQTIVIPAAVPLFHFQNCI